jgi:SAM-dependent methyltransferase
MALSMKAAMKRIPFLRELAWRIGWRLKPFPGTSAYWEARYASAGTSGRGSAGAEAAYKADILNGFVHAHSVQSVLEFGCGDGGQLALCAFPKYFGLDVSPTAVQLCRAAFAQDASKRFALISEYAGERAELTLSLDVIYHLVEGEAFEQHMRLLFDGAERFVIVYSSHSAENKSYRGSHIRQREFLPWIESHRPNWGLIANVPTPADIRARAWRDVEPAFFIFRKQPIGGPA